MQIKGQNGEMLRILPTAERQRCTMYLTTRHKRNLFKYTIDPPWSRATESRGRRETAREVHLANYLQKSRGGTILETLSPPLLFQ